MRTRSRFLPLALALFLAAPHFAHADTVTTLAHDDTVDGLALPAGTRVTRNGAGTLIEATLPPLDTSRTFLGHALPAHTQITFNGFIWSLQLPGQRLTVDGFITDPAMPVYLHRGGAVVGFQSAIEQTVDGIPVRAGSGVVLWENGRVDHVVLARDFAMLGVVARGGTMVSTDPNTGARSVTLAQAHRFLPSGVMVEAGQGVSLTPGGQLAAAVLARAESVSGVPCAAGRATFNDNGTLRVCVLSQSHAFGAVALREGDEVLLDGAGVLLRAHLEHTTMIDGQSHRPREVVTLDARGHVVGAVCRLTYQPRPDTCEGEGWRGMGPEGQNEMLE